MTFQPDRILCLRRVSRVLALLIFMLPTAASAQDILDPKPADKQLDTEERQSELPNPAFSPHGPFQGPLEIPHIARFNKLPMRMFLEPHLIAPPVVRKLDARFLPLFDRTLREIDNDELLETAAFSLARVAREKLQDINNSTDILLKHLESHSSLRVRFACARALVNADASQSAAAILKLDEFADDAQRLWIDPALARWKFAAAGEVWKRRLAADAETTMAVSLACDGLAVLGDSQVSDLLQSVLRGELLAFEKRKAAAKALSVLDPDKAFAEAESFVGGSVFERLLAIQLLSSAKPEAHARLFLLCADASDGVASSAWAALFRVNPEALIPALPTGRSHRDAVVRMTAAHIMQRFPDAERAGWLHALLSDRHLEVRNVAREMSVLVAQERPDLRDGIMAMAGDRLAANREDWQGIEQCLLLLGQLRAGQFSDRCVPLLEHPRNEVLVTSAWLIHLYPDVAVQDAVRKQLMRNEEMFKTPALIPAGADIGQQSSYLIQYAGLERLKDLQAFLEPNFSKAAPGGIYKRTAAMWTLGLFHENDPASELATSFIGRVADRVGMAPEQEVVRRMSAIALGLMRAKSGVKGLREAYELDPGNSVIPDSARWSLGMIGEPLPDPLPPYSQAVGGWRLSPVDDR
ncbi:MAG: hypothetical protein H7Z17_15670 [Fuerstia sp.]|nr:hypothetical protein [Fuerstiella sp.]